MLTEYGKKVFKWGLGALVAYCIFGTTGLAVVGVLFVLKSASDASNTKT